MGKSQVRSRYISPSDPKQNYNEQGAENPWFDAIRILEQVQGDYSQAKYSLDLLCHQFSEKEASPPSS